MTEEQKHLLLKDLCTRLPYGVKVNVSRVEEWKELTLTPFILANYYDDIEKVKPYLRPMSSMTSKEWVEFCDCSVKDEMSWVMAGNGRKLFPIYNKQDFLNAHHFDYRGLISMGLALVATEGMYETE